jgi:hypothetical protein
VRHWQHGGQTEKKRPRDPVQLAKLIGDIATGRLRTRSSMIGTRLLWNSVVQGGNKGGKARAETLKAEQRREIAKKAAEKRWSK